VYIGNQLCYFDVYTVIDHFDRIKSKMISDKEITDVQTQTNKDDDFDPIPPKEAQQRLEQAIVERLGEDWDSEDSGWLIADRTAYQARLTKGKVNLDFYVDLLGDVIVEERPTSVVQESGRWIAWMLLALSLAIALTIAQIVQSIP
jgi:hypothetical protein